EGEHDLEGGSLPEFALDVDRAAVRLHHLARDPEAEAEAAVVAGGDGALEAPEDSTLILGGDPDAVVANDDARVVVVAGDLHVDRPALPVLDRVGEEVVDDLIDAERVPL